MRTEFVRKRNVLVETIWKWPDFRDDGNHDRPREVMTSPRQSIKGRADRIHFSILAGQKLRSLAMRRRWRKRAIVILRHWFFRSRPGTYTNDLRALARLRQ